LHDHRLHPDRAEYHLKVHVRDLAVVFPRELRFLKDDDILLLAGS
jgi:hypothetical protein